MICHWRGWHAIAVLGIVLVLLALAASAVPSSASSGHFDAILTALWLFFALPTVYRALRSPARCGEQTVPLLSTASPRAPPAA